MMKWLILAGVLFIAGTFLMRKRREPDASADREPQSARRGSMYTEDDDAVNVRSADNVRLISDDQLSAIDGNRDKPVE